MDCDQDWGFPCPSHPVLRDAVPGCRRSGLLGERNYHPNYFAAYVFDSDGHTIEAVHHGPVERPVTSVRFRSTIL